MQELAISKQQQEEIKDLSLDQIADNLLAIDKQSKLMVGFYLLEARSRFPADRDFGEWRGAKFAHLAKERATELMNLARFFSDKPMAEIPLSVCYMLSAPKNEGIAEEAYQDIISTKGGKVTIQDAKEIISSYGGTSSTGDQHDSQGNNEWYTPPKYLESARTVLNGIDLDPASNDTAQKEVKAKKYYTKDTNGLDHDWAESVWLNPPYSHPEVEHFTSKLIHHYEKGDVKDAIILVNNATDTNWFHDMLDRCEAICLTKGRINFTDETGDQKLATRQGQVFLYFGNSAVTFENEFSKYGKVLSV